MSMISKIGNIIGNKRKHDQAIIKCKNRILSLFTIKELKEIYTKYIKEDIKIEENNVSVAQEIFKVITTPEPTRDDYINNIRKNLTLDQIKAYAENHNYNIKEIIKDYNNEAN